MIDFSTKLVAFDGSEIPSGPPTPPDPEVQDSKMVPAPPLTLGLACIRALISQYEDERNLDPATKFARGAMAHLIYEAKGPIQLKSGDVTMLKNLVGKCWAPMVVYLSWPLLDAAEAPAKDLAN